MIRIQPGVRSLGVGIGILLLAACASSPAQSVVPTAGAAVTSISTTLAASIVPAASSTAKVASAVQVTPRTAPVATESLAALVNKSGITVNQLNAEVNRQLVARQSLNEPAPADMGAFRSSILDSLIQQTLIEQAAAIQGVTVSDQEVQTEVQKNIQEAGSQDKWLAQIAADHMSEAEYRIGLKSALLTLKMRDFITRNIGASADQVHARHILVADLTTAQQVLTQLKGGADFKTLAAKYSLDVTTKNNGGDLGWFTRGQLLQQAIEDAAFSAPVNQFSQPIQTDLGYDILQVIERASNRPLDPAVRARLDEQTFEIWLQTLLKAATITKYV